MRIFQTSPRLSSVSRWNWSRLPRWKAPSLCRWREPLLFTPYRLMPTCAVVPDGLKHSIKIIYIIYSQRFHLINVKIPSLVSLMSYSFYFYVSVGLSLADLLRASSRFWPELCSGRVPDGHIEGPGSVSSCPSGPVYGRWAPLAGESEPGRHTQSPPLSYAPDHLTSEIRGKRERACWWIYSFLTWGCIWGMDET